MHANQFWWAWSLQFRRYCYFLNLAKFPFQTVYMYYSSKENFAKFAKSTESYEICLLHGAEILLFLLFFSLTCRKIGERTITEPLRKRL